MYKAANFEGAIGKYTQCLDRITDKSSELALKAFSNRCVKQRCMPVEVKENRDQAFSKRVFVEMCSGGGEGGEVKHIHMTRERERRCLEGKP